LTLATPTIDLDHLQRWVGKKQVAFDTASLRQAEMMRATLDLDAPEPRIDETLPPLWTWIYFPDATRNRDLGDDGYPSGAGFLPPIPLPNRMWAGGKFVFDRPIPIGATMEKRSEVASIDHKKGQSGDLLFVKLRHEFFVDGERCVSEDHDIVYRGATPPTAAASKATTSNPPPAGKYQRDWIPDSIQLFRYSALTFNSNPVHFDADYCRRTAGYDDILVHGPLSATLLACLSSEVANAPMKSFTYRARSPFFLGQRAVMGAQPRAGGCEAQVCLEDGRVIMDATATW
jgi:3-methylfumaryl-CoA hydratase